MNPKQAVKHALPRGDKTRRLPFGIGRGLRLRINLQEGQISTYLGLYEMELNRYLRHLCPRGARSYDLGGHIGYDALVLAKLSGSDVLTVESSPKWCAIIYENVSVNPRYRDLVTVFPGYVGNLSGAATSGETEVTIDQLASQYFVPDFIKIDIEGGEVDALCGATQTLTERRPNLLVEVHSIALEDECRSLLLSYGYQPKVVDQRKYLRDHRPIAHNRWIVAPGRPPTSPHVNSTT